MRRARHCRSCASSERVVRDPQRCAARAARYSDRRPRCGVLAEIRTVRRNVQLKREQRRLPFGGDKWGRDVLKKVIKGTETSLFVGLAAAAAGHRCSARYSAHLPVITVARSTIFSTGSTAFLPQCPTCSDTRDRGGAKSERHADGGSHTRPHRLDRDFQTGPRRVPQAQSREYIQAADAIGASNARRMFVHICLT